MDGGMCIFFSLARSALAPIGLKNNKNATLGPSKFGVYSFSLKPEMYYPTGQVNMSRISHKLFTIEISPVNDVFENDTRVYALSYNILRISSGLAGLKF